MRVSIIKDDNHLYIDGTMYKADCSGLPEGFHALQWYDTWGEVETVDEHGHHVSNKRITDVTPFLETLRGTNSTS